MSCTNPLRYVDHLFQNIKKQINRPKKKIIIIIKRRPKKKKEEEKGFETDTI